MDKIRIVIDGKECFGLPKQTILAVAQENDIFIPTLCFDERVAIYGSCGICAVSYTHLTDAEINTFCTLNFGTTFPRFSKIEVNGENEDPLFTFLKKEKGTLLGSNIKWNFTKFLIDRQGNVVGRYSPTDKPDKLEKLILQLL